MGMPLGITYRIGDHMDREYRGHVIIREDNGAVGQVLNTYPGRTHYYKVTWEGRTLAEFDTLTRARQWVDLRICPPARTAQVARALASLQTVTESGPDNCPNRLNWTVDYWHDCEHCR